MKQILGTMRLPQTHEEIVKWLVDAHKEGINWIDTAWIYGQSTVEKRLGLALTELRTKGIEFKIQSKIWTSKFRKVRFTFKEQLEALKISKIDSMLLHRPSLNFEDDIDAWKELICLQKQGLVDHIGLSNYDKDMIIYLVNATGVKPEINQVELSVSNFRADRVHYAMKEKIEIQSWSSFGNDVKANLEHKIVVLLAAKYKVSPGTILISFLTSQGIIPIHASFKKKHLHESINTVQLSAKDLKSLSELNHYDNKFTETYP